MADEKPNNIFVRRLKDEEQQPKHISTETEPHRWCNGKSGCLRCGRWYIQSLVVSK